MLGSSLFAGNPDAALIEAGGRQVGAPEASGTVLLIQEALLVLGMALPAAGADGIFGEETAAAVSGFKADRLVLPSNPIVGPGTIRRLDLELAWLEGSAPDPTALDAKTLSLDPFQAGVLELQLASPGIGQKVIDTFQLGDRLCFRASFLFDNVLMRFLGRMIEPFVFEDFCAQRGPCGIDDFFDRDLSPTPYVDFLLAHNPLLDPVRLGELGQLRRPDILTHRAPAEWWEVKPASVFSALEAVLKLNEIVPNYAARGLPYLPGRSYQPSPEIVLGRFITPEGEKLDLVLAIEHKAPGLLFWTLCVKGDYVAYFNRVRLAVGIAALLVALAEMLLPAAEAAAAMAAVKEALTALGAAALPLLAPR